MGIRLTNPFNISALKGDRLLRHWIRMRTPRTSVNMSVFQDIIDQNVDVDTWKRNVPQGGYMDLIKFESYEKVTVKGFSMLQIKGSYYEDCPDAGKDAGDKFETRIFASAKEMVGPLQDAQKGDILGITFKKNGRYRNAIKIINETKNGNAAPRPTTTQGFTGTNAQPISTGTVMVPSVDPKSENAKLACDFYVKMIAAKANPNGIMEAFKTSLDMADMVEDWKEGKGAFALNANTDLPNEADLEDIDEE